MEHQVVVSVTEEDLTKGIQNDAEKTAVALAASRAFHGLKVWECPAVLIVTPETGKDVWYDLPPEARKLIDYLDSGQWEEAEPITFTITRTERPDNSGRTVTNTGVRYFS